jgi:hypothetical protein
MGDFRFFRGFVIKISGMNLAQKAFRSSYDRNESVLCRHSASDVNEKLNRKKLFVTQKCYRGLEE